MGCACKECSYHNAADVADVSCKDRLVTDALKLINRQKAEIERLTNKCEDCGGCTAWVCDCSNIEAAAYEKFAELLCEGRVSNDPVVIAAKCLLKEMTEETK